MTTLKRLRLERGLTLRAAGELLDTSRMAMLRWESGEHEPTWQNVRKLERLFGLPIEVLLSFESRATIPTGGPK